jgi:hypothetical protein
MITPTEYIQASNNNALLKDYKKHQDSMKTKNIVSLSVCVGGFSLLVGSTILACAKQREYEKNELNHTLNHIVIDHIPVIGLDYIVETNKNETIIDNNYNYVKNSQDYEH